MAARRKKHKHKTSDAEAAVETTERRNTKKHKNTINLMRERRLLLGDEAIALGAVHAGLSGCYAYPGTPSTEITEFVQGDATARARGIHCRWSSNEKTAMEEALGMSYMGKRAIVCMKHVGMNVCADAFVNSAMTGTNGGLVVVAADDPSMHSSQNEQDSRFYGKFAMVPVFEPSSQQEAYDMMKDAFCMSEEYKIPVLLRIVTRMAHSRAVVETGEIREPNPMRYPDNPKEWVLLPAVARRRNERLTGMQNDLERRSEESEYNKYIDGADTSVGIIACGIAYNYLMENFKDGCPHPVLKVSQYPLPVNAVRRLASKCQSLLVLEDGQPVVEEMLLGVLEQSVRIEGRLSGAVPRTGELTPDNVASALGLKNEEVFAPSELVMPRPPALCRGCGHRDMFAALNNVLSEYANPRVFGDIGCYTLGYLPPYQALHSVVDMGASITMAKGAADAGQWPSVAVIGDSTFTHSGMTGLLDAVNSKSNIVIIISDNLTTGMTGGQDSAGTGRIESICLGIGVEPEHVRTVIPLPKNMAEMEDIIRQEIEYQGVSVIVPRRECIQTARRHAKQTK